MGAERRGDLLMTEKFTRRGVIASLLALVGWGIRPKRTDAFPANVPYAGPFEPEEQWHVGPPGDLGLLIHVFEGGRISVYHGQERLVPTGITIGSFREFRGKDGTRLYVRRSGPGQLKIAYLCIPMPCETDPRKVEYVSYGLYNTMPFTPTRIT